MLGAGQAQDTKAAPPGSSMAMPFPEGLLTSLASVLNLQPPSPRRSLGGPDLLCITKATNQRTLPQGVCCFLQTYMSQLFFC